MLFRSITEGNITFEKLNNAAKRFLSMDLHKLGYVFEDSSVIKSVKRQIPFTVEYPNSVVSKNIKSIAIKLTDDTDIDVKDGRGFDSFFRRVFNFFR